MISSLCWIPRGVAKTIPDRYEISAEALAEMQAAKDKLEQRRGNSTPAENGKLDANGLPVELRMDDYGEAHDSTNWDESDDDGQADIDMEDEQSNEEGEMDEEDIQDEDEDDDLGSDEEDYHIKDSDKMLVVAHTDEEYSCLEIYVYDEEAGSLYVHHDIPLPAFPLCTAWAGCGKNVLGDKATTTSRNYVAVGTFKPEVELWNLDVLDALEPTITLGSEGSKDPHTDAVMGVAWNSHHHNLLATGSADKTVKLWDLTTCECVRTFRHHKDKVQSVAWNPVESSVLLTGSFDRTLAVFDAQQENGNVLSFKLGSDVECAQWNPHHPEQVLASTEDGKVTCFDVRSPGSGPLYSFQAHPRKPCSAFSFSKTVKGLLATCSPDKSVSLWNVENTSKPQCIGTKKMAIGAIFDCAFDVSEPYMLAAGGDQGMLGLWNIANDPPANVNLEAIFNGNGATPPLPPTTEQVTEETAKETGNEEEEETERKPSAAKKKSKKKKGKKNKN